MTSNKDKNRSAELRELTLAKMTNVLGADRAQRLLDRLLGELAIELETPHELLLLSQRMSQLGGFEAAVGGMLGVIAVLRGATPGSNERTAERSSNATKSSS